MNTCTKCGTLVDRELGREEEEGGYAYCDDCEAQYHKDMAAEEARLNKEGRSLYGVICGACGYMMSHEHASYGGDCPRCGGYGYDMPDENEMAQIEADNTAEQASYNLRVPKE